jgi:hypothetical protein
MDNILEYFLLLFVIYTAALSSSMINTINNQFSFSASDIYSIFLQPTILILTISCILITGFFIDAILVIFTRRMSLDRNILYILLLGFEMIVLMMLCIVQMVNINSMLDSNSYSNVNQLKGTSISLLITSFIIFATILRHL